MGGGTAITTLFSAPDLCDESFLCFFSTRLFTFFSFPAPALLGSFSISTAAPSAPATSSSSSCCGSPSPFRAPRFSSRSSLSRSSAFSCFSSSTPSSSSSFSSLPFTTSFLSSSPSSSSSTPASAPAHRASVILGDTHAPTAPGAAPAPRAAAAASLYSAASLLSSFFMLRRFWLISDAENCRGSLRDGGSER
jgi:hypothetical protein